MRPLVYQIVMGEIPKQLVHCVESVKKYADDMGYGYRCDTEMPKWATALGMDYRMASEWMRVEFLASRPYVLYVDWDVEIKKNFELKEDIVTMPFIDTMLYYGPHIDIAKEVLKIMGERSKSVPHGIGKLSFDKVFKGDVAKYYLPSNTYYHINWGLAKVLYN